MTKQAYLSPGEQGLLRFMRNKKQIEMRRLMREKDFHGWDRESLMIMAERLKEMGVLDISNDTLSLRHASIEERVAVRFVQEFNTEHGLHG